MSIVFFLMGPHNSKSLKYWPNDEPGFMTGLFYGTKILLKLYKGSVYTKPQKWV